jgi:uncharacterized repeat protein (TIGR01451 family)
MMRSQRWGVLVAAVMAAAATTWTPTPAFADADGPECFAAGIAAGTLTPGLPGGMVNEGTTTLTVTGRSEKGCGWAPDSTLHHWSGVPTWFQAATAAQLAANPAPTAKIAVTRDESTGTTETSYPATLPRTGETWVGVRYRIDDAATKLGFGVNQSTLLPTRIVVRTRPTLVPPPPVLAHDAVNTPLSGRAWPGDRVSVTDQDGNLFCDATADAKGAWRCVAAQAFAHGTTALTVTAHGMGANNPAYPGISDALLPDLTGNTARTHVLSADPALTKELDNATPRVGDVVRYTLTAVNLGLDTAVGVTVTDRLPAGLTYVSAKPDVGSYDPAMGVWHVGNLAPRARQRLVLAARVTKAGGLTNPAVIAAAGATDGVSTSRLRGADGLPDGNIDAANDRDSAKLTTAPWSELRVTKQVVKGRYRVGDLVTFTIRARNEGPDAARGVWVTEQLAPGLALVSTSSSVGRFDRAAGEWLVGALPVGRTATLTLRARLTRPGQIRNSASIGSTPTGPGAVFGQQAPLPALRRISDTAEVVIRVAPARATRPGGVAPTGDNELSASRNANRANSTNNRNSAIPPDPDPAGWLAATGTSAGVVASIGLAGVLVGLALLVAVGSARRHHRSP